MDDALEILDEIQKLANSLEGLQTDYVIASINDYINQKRTEFEEPNGDCCG
jgi:hypothetical protein